MRRQLILRNLTRNRPEAALLGAAGEHGYMSTILRTDWDNYQVRYDKDSAE
ncbi:MAG: hypothetical protein R3C02_05615 [Planctomycetaceae bacterium]